MDEPWLRKSCKSLNWLNELGPTWALGHRVTFKFFVRNRSATSWSNWIQWSSAWFMQCFGKNPKISWISWSTGGLVQGLKGVDWLWSTWKVSLLLSDCNVCLQKCENVRRTWDPRLAKEAGRKPDPRSLSMINEQLRAEISSLQKLVPCLQGVWGRWRRSSRSIILSPCDLNVMLPFKQRCLTMFH